MAKYYLNTDNSNPGTVIGIVDMSDGLSDTERGVTIGVMGHQVHVRVVLQGVDYDLAITASVIHKLNHSVSNRHVLYTVTR